MVLVSNTRFGSLYAKHNIAEAVKESDLVIGAVLIPGAKAPKLVTEEMIQSLEYQLIDISYWSMDNKLKCLLLQRLKERIEGFKLDKIILEAINTHLTEAEYIRVIDFLSLVEKKWKVKICLGARRRSF